MHAPGDATLLIEERGILGASDILSDVLVPMLDLEGADLIEDYLAALRLLEDVAGDAEAVVRGHGPLAEPVRCGRGSSWTGRTCSRCDGHSPDNPRMLLSARPGRAGSG
ncbi:hypothetical protein [Nonomuraea composti]|uniref:hypothetical protein n=1 Tax=Nonomuraea composti TaxID=2720023 RepID=UPI001F1185B9|nr:hypothetical protein [Nonomuraea sp. FMUSA5-5]